MGTFSKCKAENNCSNMKLNLSLYRKSRRRIPNSIAQLINDERYIFHILKKIYNHNRDGLEKVELKKDGTHCDIKGNLSDSARLRIFVKTVEGVEHSYHWFVKVQPVLHIDKDLETKFNAFKNEIEFYSKIGCDLKKFIEESSADVQLDLPEMLFAEVEDDGAIIVLEDLITDGYRQERDGNGNRYLSKEKAILAIESVAKIHAASYALQNKKHIDLASDHPMLKKSGLLWTNSEMASRLSTMKNIYCGFLKQSQNPDSPALHDRFTKKYDSDDFLRQLCIDRCSQDEETILCLQQGDFHFNNLMFKEEAGKLKVKIVDWQMAYNGKSAGDITYLLMSSIDPEDFEKEEENIKEKYHKSFQNTLAALNLCYTSDGDTDKDANHVDEVFEIEYDKSLLLGFLFSCGNVMQMDNFQNDDNRISFSYKLCKEAAEKELI